MPANKTRNTPARQWELPKLLPTRGTGQTAKELADALLDALSDDFDIFLLAQAECLARMLCSVAAISLLRCLWARIGFGDPCVATHPPALSCCCARKPPCRRF